MFVKSILQSTRIRIRTFLRVGIWHKFVLMCDSDLPIRSVDGDWLIAVTCQIVRYLPLVVLFSVPTKHNALWRYRILAFVYLANCGWWLQMRFHKAREDMKAKQHAIEDAAKKTAEMQTRFWIANFLFSHECFTLSSFESNLTHPFILRTAHDLPYK